MPEYLAPGVYIEEVSAGLRTIEGVSTSTCGFVGVAEKGPINRPVLITNLGDFYKTFGRPLDLRQRHYLGYAVEGFFREGGSRCYVVRVAHYSNILDRNSLTAGTAETVFNNQSLTDVLTVRAANPGEWGLHLNVAIANSSKFGTSLATDLVAGTYRRLTLRNSDGIKRGTMLWLAKPIFASIAYDRTDPANPVLRIDRDRGLIRDPDGTALNNGDVIAQDSLVMTPDFTFMANLSAGITLGPDNPEPALNNSSMGITAVNEDVLGNALPEGATIWIIPPTMEGIAIVDHVEGNDVVLKDDLIANETFPADSKVLTRDFKLMVREGGNTVETFENLSTVSANRTDFASNRINIGMAPSRYINVTSINSEVPMQNATFSNLARSTGVTNLDGLVALNPFDYIGSPASETGISAFDAVDDVNILLVPYPNFTDATITDTDGALKTVYDEVTTYCENRNYLFCIIDCKPEENQVDTLTFKNSLNPSNYASYYYPWLQIKDSQNDKKRVSVPPSGFIAGLYAYTDKHRGVHKAPAGITEGKVKSAAGIEAIISKGEQDVLNRFGVNVIRSFLGSGLNVWGARTISTSSEWTYINVRRLFNFIEKSIDMGTQWIVFEANDPKLWKDIARTIKSFLRVQWRAGALFGETEDQAFRVKCDAETNTPESIELGQVITEVAIAPVKPAEFVIFRITQTAAGSAISE